MSSSRARFWAIANTIVLVLVIYWNYYANAQGINENSVGSLSDQYSNYFTPSGYAFSIWGLIYIALTINAVYLLRCAFRNTEAELISIMSPLLIVANIGNAIWIWLWLTERTGLSVLIMLLILVSLLANVIRLKLGVSETSIGIKRWAWWPASLYAGWITVATVANVSAYLAKINWQFGLHEMNWAITMIIIATAIYAFVLIKRNMITFSLVGVWAIVAIAMKHWNTVPILPWVALSCAAILIALLLVKKATKTAP